MLGKVRLAQIKLANQGIEGIFVLSGLNFELLLL
jgi:hypothetical protein